MKILKDSGTLSVRDYTLTKALTHTLRQSKIPGAGIICSASIAVFAFKSASELSKTRQIGRSPSTQKPLRRIASTLDLRTFLFEKNRISTDLYLYCRVFRINSISYSPWCIY